MVSQTRKQNIAVLMTCHNRRETTLQCLTALYAQENITEVCLEVYLVDDGCTDGTDDAVRKNFPDVHVIQGEGNLYWNGGMRVAWKEAMQSQHDFFLWLNDDSILYPFAFKMLLDTNRNLQTKQEKPAIIVGSMQDATTNEFSYGGKIRRNPLLLLPLHNVFPEKTPIPCDTANGNCVLIPSSVVTSIGILDKKFTHGIGDFDYSLRAQKVGISSWVAPGFVGTCSKNNPKNSVHDNNIPFQKRVEMLSHPTSLPPAKEMMVFIKRHGGIFWPAYWCRYLLRGYFPELWVRIHSRTIRDHHKT